MIRWPPRASGWCRCCSRPTPPGGARAGRGVRAADTAGSGLGRAGGPVAGRTVERREASRPAVQAGHARRATDPRTGTGREVIGLAGRRVVVVSPISERRDLRVIMALPERRRHDQRAGLRRTRLVPLDIYRRTGRGTEAPVYLIWAERAADDPPRSAWADPRPWQEEAAQGQAADRRTFGAMVGFLGLGAVGLVAVLARPPASTSSRTCTRSGTRQRRQRLRLNYRCNAQQERYEILRELPLRRFSRS